MKSCLYQVFKPDIGTSISRAICTCSVPLRGRAVVREVYSHAKSMPGSLELLDCDK